MAGMWLWWIMGITIILVFVWAALPSTRRAGGDADHSAERILKERYARGEIDHDEYQKRLRDLRL